jgi:hypothetical protein
MLLLTIEIGVLYQDGATSPIVTFQCLGIASLENEIAHEETRKPKAGDRLYFGLSATY